MLDLFLSPGNVAKLLKVSDQTVINLCNKGALNHLVIGKQYRIYKEAVEKLIGRPIKAGGETPE